MSPSREDDLDKLVTGRSDLLGFRIGYMRVTPELLHFV